MVKGWRWSLIVNRTCFSLLLTCCLLAAVLADDSTQEADGERLKRNSESSALTPEESLLLAPELTNLDLRDKKAPRGFLGLRGKKGSPSGFLGLRGRRLNFGGGTSDTELPSSSLRPYTGDAPSSVMPLSDPTGEHFEMDKKAHPNSNYYTYRGKKLPSGFMGLRGKKIPAGFMGLRGKKAPNYFLGLRGKKEDDSPSYDDLEDLLQAMKYRYRINYMNKQDSEKRSPKGFLGLRGKKAEDINDVFDYDLKNDVTLGNRPIGYSPLYDRPVTDFDKRAPRGFLGMRG